MGRRLLFTAIGAALLAIGGFVWSSRTSPLPMPASVRMAQGTQTFRPAGEFRQGTRLVDAPLETIEVPALDVMKFHVSEADYALCVADSACDASPAGNRRDVAQTNVNYIDATAYARWFSDRTGAEWRLPTDAEWLRLAGDRAFDDAFEPEANGADPSRRWIAAYRREVERRGAADPETHRMGYFGENDSGVSDIAGNVWEWTESCFQNGTLTPDGRAIETRSDYCGIRAVQGKHRGFVTGFVRDARSGGCAAGVPPDHLGFRLVHTAS